MWIQENDSHNEIWGLINSEEGDWRIVDFKKNAQESVAKNAS